MRKLEVPFEWRWDTCMHEAAHALAVLHYDVGLGDVWLTHGGEGGFTAWPVNSLDITVEEEAFKASVIAYVGPVQTWRGPMIFPYGLESDLKNTKDRLVHFPYLYDDVKAEAKELVRRNKRDITRIARELWRTDKIKAGMIHNASKPAS